MEREKILSYHNTIRRHNPQEFGLSLHRRENLKFSTVEAADYIENVVVGCIKKYLLPKNTFIFQDFRKRNLKMCFIVTSLYTLHLTHNIQHYGKGKIALCLTKYHEMKIYLFA
jgi:hypothetical protein